MAEWTMAVTNPKEVLECFTAYIWVDDIGILVYFVGVGRDAAFLGPVGKSHHVLEVVIAFLDLKERIPP